MKYYLVKNYRGDAAPLRRNDTVTKNPAIIEITAVIGEHGTSVTTLQKYSEFAFVCATSVQVDAASEVFVV